MRKRNKGFTLIEIMLVVIIIAALSAMVVPRLVGRSEQAKVSVAKADIGSQLATALKLYELDNGTFPSTEQFWCVPWRQLQSHPDAARNISYISKNKEQPMQLVLTI